MATACVDSHLLRAVTDRVSSPSVFGVFVSPLISAKKAVHFHRFGATPYNLGNFFLCV